MNFPLALIIWSSSPSRRQMQQDFGDLVDTDFIRWSTRFSRWIRRLLIWTEIRQGYLDDYSQQNGNVGIGTSVSNEKLEIVGGTTTQELNVTGISTLTHVSGFIKKHVDYTENVNITAGDSGTLSGEISCGCWSYNNCGNCCNSKSR